MSTTNPNPLQVFPKFSPNSFWNLQAVCDVWGARCPAPPLGLITLAGCCRRRGISASSTATPRS